MFNHTSALMIAMSIIQKTDPTDLDALEAAIIDALMRTYQTGVRAGKREEMTHDANRRDNRPGH